MYFKWVHAKGVFQCPLTFIPTLSLLWWRRFLSNDNKEASVPQTWHPQPVFIGHSPASSLSPLSSLRKPQGSSLLSALLQHSLKLLAWSIEGVWFHLFPLHFSQNTTIQPQHLNDHLLTPQVPVSQIIPLISVKHHVGCAFLSSDLMSYTQNTRRHNNPLSAHLSTLSPDSPLSEHIKWKALNKSANWETITKVSRLICHMTLKGWVIKEQNCW